MTRASWATASALAVWVACWGAFVFACSSSSTASASGDAGNAGDDSGAAGDAAPAYDANGPGITGTTCSCNRDCVIADRCSCDEDAGTCACQPGARGTGQSGVTSCTSGDQCASSICVEGNGGVYYCTDECATAANCPPKLPVCSDIAFVGRICVRDPNGG